MCLGEWKFIWPFRSDQLVQFVKLYLQEILNVGGVYNRSYTDGFYYLIMDLNFNLFGKAVPKLTPSEQAKEWKKKLAQEGRKLDREIEKMSATEKKALTGNRLD